MQEPDEGCFELVVGESERYCVSQAAALEDTASVMRCSSAGLVTEGGGGRRSKVGRRRQDVRSSAALSATITLLGSDQLSTV